MGHDRNPSLVDDELDGRFESGGLQFLWAELTAGSTLAGLARTAPHDRENRHWSRRQAQAAYDTVVAFLPLLALTAEEHRQVSAALEALRQDIEAIPVG
ncbi:MAG: hypothetical protein IT184_02090 [Acidobacteria bacterium]|nr:hypothetical protein [Acidobacteriota bacterium]